MITSPITVSAQKAVNLDCDEMLIWGCVGKQTMVSGASDPVYFYFKIDTETYGTGLIKRLLRTVLYLASNSTFLATV